MENVNIIDMIQRATSKLEELYAIHDWFFAVDKTEKQKMMQSLVLEIDGILNSINSTADIESTKETVAYIKGKANNCFDAYSPLAEELLSLAVKLDPTNFKAWTALGQCMWKKGEKLQAKNYFIESLNQQPNKEALCELSIVMRQMSVKGQDKSSLVEESIKLAKKAIELDLNDHKSWYILGNAWCARYFSKSTDIIDLRKALNSYKRSIDLGGTENPDLYFNQGNVFRYLQQYSAALISFQRAVEIDISFSDASEAINEITAFIAKVNDLINHHGRLRKKRLEQLIAEFSLPAILPPPPPSTSTTTTTTTTSYIGFQSLHPGINANVILPLKVILPLSKGTMPPKSFLCVDSSGAFGVLAIYYISEDATQFTTEQTILVTNPHLREISTHRTITSSSIVHDNITTTEKRSEHDDNMLIVQIFDILTLTVDGHLLNRSSIAAPQLKIEAFDA